MPAGARPKSAPFRRNYPPGVIKAILAKKKERDAKRSRDSKKSTSKKSRGSKKSRDGSEKRHKKLRNGDESTSKKPRDGSKKHRKKSQDGDELTSASKKSHGSEKHSKKSHSSGKHSKKSRDGSNKSEHNGSEETSDKFKHSNKKESDKKASDKKASDKKASDKKASDKKASDKKASSKKSRRLTKNADGSPLSPLQQAIERAKEKRRKNRASGTKLSKREIAEQKSNDLKSRPPPKPYRPRRIFSEEEVKDLLKGFVEIDREHWTNIKSGLGAAGSYVRFFFRDGAFSPGGYVQANPLDVRTRLSPDIPIRFIKIRPYAALYRKVKGGGRRFFEYLAPYHDIARIFQRLDASSLANQDTLGEMADSVNTQFRKLVPYIVKLKKENTDIRNELEALKARIAHLERRASP